MKIKCAILISIFCWSCSSSDEARINPEKVPEIVGHAGMGFRSLINPFNPLPDNSLASINKALSLGADGIEVDVQMTKDCVLVLYHDMRLESKTNGKGCIGELMAKDVIGLDYEMGFPYDLFQEEKLITLEKVLMEFKKRAVFPSLYLDIHSYNYCKDGIKGYRDVKAFAAALEKLENKYNISKNIIYTSTYELLLEKIQETGAEGKLFFEEDIRFDRGVKIIEKYGFEGIVIKKSLIEPEQVKKAQNKGISVVIFGGKSKSTLKSIAQMNPDVMQVNNISAIKKILN